MNFNEYKEKIKNVPYTNSLEYQQAILWLHPEILPLGVVSIGTPGCSVIKVPEKATNKYGRIVPVIAISPKAFCEKKDLTDIVLPQSIERIGGLRRVFKSKSNYNSRKSENYKGRYFCRVQQVRRYLLRGNDGRMEKD